MKSLLSLLVFDSIFAYIAILVTLIVIIMVPRIFRIAWINGLLFAQITLFFTSLTTIGGLNSGTVTQERGFHFICIEFIFYLLIYALYAFLLQKRLAVLRAFSRLFYSNAVYVVILSVMAMVLINYINIAEEGSSRIAYMTSRWFSFVKPFIQLCVPLSSLGVIFLLLKPKKRVLAYLLLFLIVLANILTGSKASFAVTLFTSFLLFRDLVGNAAQLKVRQIDKVFASIFILGALIFALSRLEVTGFDLFDRFLFSGEANLMTYFSDNPTAACDDVSMFAKMSRGLARAFGDPTATNIDTLFGYALMIQAIGVNTFTGPNARLSAYALCNFPDANVVYFIIVASLYLYLLRTVFLKFLSFPLMLAVLFPYLVTSLSSAAQDFNLIMQDTSYFLFLLILGGILPSKIVANHG